MKTTDVFVERLNEDENFAGLKDIKLDQLKTIRLLEVKTHKQLIDLNYWDRRWIVKFALQPKLVKNLKTKELKYNHNILQLAFEHKEIGYKWRELTRPKFTFDFKEPHDNLDD